MDTSEMLMKLEETAALLIAAAVQVRQGTEARDQEIAAALCHALKALDMIEDATQDELRELIESDAAERVDIETNLAEQFDAGM